jgi:hypothetical protein
MAILGVSRSLLLSFVVLVACGGLIHRPIAGQDPPEKDEVTEGDADDEAKATKEAIAEVADVFERVKIESFASSEWKTSRLAEKPALTFGDPTRGNTRGTLWTWGEKGRPSVVAEVYRVSTFDGWVLVFFNTSGGKVKASLDGNDWWNENQSTSKFEDLADTPKPAATNAARQRQIKSIAGRFSAHQFWDPDNSRFELRAIERPLLTYADPENGILDGALFTFANGTNPEILLMVEARAGSNGKPDRYQFAVGRLAHAELHLAFDEKEIYSAPRGWTLCGPDKSYFSESVAAPRKR